MGIRVVHFPISKDTYVCGQPHPVPKIHLDLAMKDFPDPYPDLVKRGVVLISCCPRTWSRSLIQTFRGKRGRKNKDYFDLQDLQKTDSLKVNSSFHKYKNIWMKIPNQHWLFPVLQFFHTDSASKEPQLICLAKLREGKFYLICVTPQGSCNTHNLPSPKLLWLEEHYRKGGGKIQ